MEKMGRIDKIIKLFSVNSTFIKNIVLLTMLGRLCYLEDDMFIKLFESLIVTGCVFINPEQLEDVT